MHGRHTIVGFSVSSRTFFKAFIAYELPEMRDFLNEKATIKRDFNLDLQAKGVAGAKTRDNAKRKRDDRVNALAKRRKVTFVPLVRKIIDIGEKVRNVNWNNHTFYVEASSIYTRLNDSNALSSGGENHETKEHVKLLFISIIIIISLDYIHL